MSLAKTSIRVFFSMILLSLAGLMLSGCLMVFEKNLEEVPEDHLSFCDHPVHLYAKWGARLKGDQDEDSVFDYEMSAAYKGIREKYFTDYITKHHCCKLVDSRNEADIIIDGVFFVTVPRDALFFSSLTSLSLYTIPSWFTQELHFQADVRRGDQLRTYNIRSSYTIYQWLPLIFAYPFSEPADSGNRILVKNVYDHFLMKLSEDGFIRPDSSV